MTPQSVPSIPRLRLAATLLLSLPAIVATACFAHGHGALGSWSLLAVLAAAIAAGAAGAHALLAGPARTPTLSGRQDLAAVPASRH